MNTCVSLQIKGIVQGVGFRPFVFREAKKHLISGFVKNSLEGVLVEAQGEEKNVNAFVMSISENAPAPANIKEIDIKEIPLQKFENFKILESDKVDTDERTLVCPDLGICDDCLRELFDKNDRRYHYPFINCTNCGPRFTIIDSLPYDRSSTSMKKFKMCQQCSAEFKDPADRRFHAQPDACFECGPSLFFYDYQKSAKVSQQSLKERTWDQGSGNSGFTQRNASNDANFSSIEAARENSDEIINAAARMLVEGKIIAVKGLGGYHLVCDAKNENSLATLRDQKKRDNKAFAVMVKSSDVAKEFCHVSKEEDEILKSCERPIVLLKKKEGIPLPCQLSGDLPELGVMLPCTPVQALLIDAFQRFTDDGSAMLVMTSGNLHDEPIVTEDDEALAKFQGVADAVLGNDREILTRFDDSVVRVLDFGEDQTALQVIRRARGQAPKPINVKTEYNGEMFATGPEQKNTFCYIKNNQAFVSQHIGDVEDLETQDAWFEAKARFEKLFGFDGNCDIVCDKHPEYLTSKWAFKQATQIETTVKLDEVFHHHAHIVSAMAENEVNEPAIGFAFDGTGFGADGCIWGGEVLLCNLETFERVANFAYFPLPGGAQAINNPLRCAYGLAYACDIDEAVSEISEEMGDEAEVCRSMIEENINTPYTSSLGRIFDAVSAYLGICVKPTYEGEAAILLEASIKDEFFDDYDAQEERYSFDILKNTATEHSTALDTSMFVIDPKKVFVAIAEDKKNGVENGLIARRFHDAIVRLVVQVSQITFQIYGIEKVVLSGGVWMNRHLIEHSVQELAEAGFDVVLNRDLPPNDGGVSYGQAVVAMTRKMAKAKEE